MRLEPEQRRRLHVALLDAFDHGSLERVAAFHLGVRLGDITAPGNFSAIVLELIEWTEAEDRIPDLLAGARAENSTNRGLREVAALLEVDPDAPSEPEPAATPLAFRIYLDGADAEARARSLAEALGRRGAQQVEVQRAAQQGRTFRGVDPATAVQLTMAFLMAPGAIDSALQIFDRLRGERTTARSDAERPDAWIETLTGEMVPVSRAQLEAATQTLSAQAMTPPAPVAPTAPPAAAGPSRMELLLALKRLLPEQFEELLFLLEVPHAVLPGESAPQGARARKLLVWLETQASGTEPLQAAVREMAPRLLP